MLNVTHRRVVISKKRANTRMNMRMNTSRSRHICVETWRSRL